MSLRQESARGRPNLLHPTMAVMLSALCLLQPSVAHAGLTNQQIAELFGPDVQPGTYQLHPMHRASGCIGVAYVSEGREQYFISAPDCNEHTAMLVVPTAHGNTVTFRPMRRPRQCATAARGVVLGPPSVDALVCERGDAGLVAGPSCLFGAPDQRFIARIQPTSEFRIDYLESDAVDGNTRVFDVRDSGQGGLTELILWDWHGGENQKFVFERTGDLPVAESACAQGLGWVQAPDGLRRAHPVAGVVLIGGDYASEKSDNDGGKDCAARCVADTRCHAFSWVRPGVQDEAAVCWLKNFVPAPSLDGNVTSGVVRAR